MADVKAGRLFSLNNYFVGEDLSAQIDGLTDTFTIANNYVAGSIAVYVNGLRQQKGVGKDYIESAANQIQLAVIVAVDEIIIVDYIKT